MATDTSDESSSSDTKEYKKVKQKQRFKHKNQGDYNTFVVPEILCQCQQKCTERVTASLIQKISMYFFGFRNSKEKQKSYLASLILAKEKQIDVNTFKGKRVRKMSYRYFVPIITDEDLKVQSQENNYFNCEEESKNYKAKKSSGKIIINPMFKEKNWDHIEVCLKAFTSIHIISEKKVIVTRSVCQLNQTIRCSRPFQKDNYNNSNVQQDQIKQTSSSKADGSRNVHIASTSDICAATAAWLSQSNKSSSTFPVNPKTYLPEGLILPDSIVCLPIFADGNHTPSNPDHDVDIIDNFFCNQLWKPEYIADSTSNCGAKEM